jgi:hypothetical protein
MAQLVPTWRDLVLPDIPIANGTNASAKAKEAPFSQRTYNNNKLDPNNMLKNMFNILHLLKVNLYL